MKAIVLGATGHIGSAICHGLTGLGWEVTAASRRSTWPASLAECPVERFSVASREALERAVRADGYDWLIDAAAAYPLDLFRDGEAAVRQAFERTEWLLKLTREHGVGLAYVSSFTTLVGLGEGSDRWSRELGKSHHTYFQLKQAVEALVLNAEQPTCVINPTMCLGPWDNKRQDMALVPMLLNRRLPSFVDHVVNVVDVRDVAAMTHAGMVDSNLHGLPLLVTGHNLSLKRLVHQVCELADVPKPALETPMNVGLAASVWFEALYAALGQRSPSPALALLLVAQHRRIPVNPLQLSTLGEPTPLAATLQDAIDWHRRAV